MSLALYNKAMWLLHEYLFLQLSMQACSFDIKVSNHPLVLSCQCYNWIVPHFTVGTNVFS
jgi:hypothetical protein